jgi:hypothetical protein
MAIPKASRWGIASLSVGLLLIVGVAVMVFVIYCDDDEQIDRPNAATQPR